MSVFASGHTRTDRMKLRRFGAMLKTYTQLAEIILHSIRTEIRCRTIYYLDAAFRQVSGKLR